MKKISVIAIAAALILWGLSKSPQSSEIVSRTFKDIKSTAQKLTNSNKENSALPENLAENVKKLDTLIAELDLIKADYEERLTQYKKLDAEFSALVLKNRNNPNTEVLKEKEAALEDQFVILRESLKNYQEKSQELYKFQSSTLSI